MGRVTGGGRGTLPSGVRRVLWWGVLAVVATGCDRQPPPLEVGPLGFSAADLGVLGPDQQEELADLAAFGLVVAEGRTDSLIQPRVERDLRSLVLQRLAMELAANRAGLGEPELRLAYEQNPQHELVVRHLVVLSERWRPSAHRDSARAVATEALERARAGESFDRLAAEYSDEPGAAERGGLLQPGRRGSWVPDFWRAASSLDTGQVSPVVETEFGFHVLKLEERRRVPFEEVREEVLRDVMDLPRAVGRAEDWASQRMKDAEVDTDAVRSWIAPADSEGIDGTTTLVRWPDSLRIPPFTAADMGSFRHNAPGGSLEALRGEGLGTAVEWLLSQAQSHMMVHRARALGIEVSRPQRAAIEERWARKVAEWAGALGFEPGLSRQRVKEQALQSLGTPEQNAAIARSELSAFSPRLRELYPVSRREVPTP